MTIEMIQLLAEEAGRKGEKFIRLSVEQDDWNRLVSEMDKYMDFNGSASYKLGSAKLVNVMSYMYAGVTTHISIHHVL